MRHERMDRRRAACCAVGIVTVLASRWVLGANPDNMTVVVSSGHATSGGGALNGYVYDAANNDFYTGVVGASKLFRRYDADTNTSEKRVAETDSARFARAIDVPNGLTYLGSGSAGEANPQGMLANPATLVVGGITYGPGELIFINDNGQTVQQGFAIRYDLTKRMYRFDKRKVGGPTSGSFPDYANAQDGADPNTVMGALNFVDWNDAFTVVYTKQDVATASGGSVSGSDFGTYQFCWSSDGRYIYAVDGSSPHGGIYKIDAASSGSGALVRKYANPDLTVEPTMVRTAVRNFTGSGPADQILVNGTTASGNVGGLDCFLDTGSSFTGPFALITESQFETAMQWNGKFMARSESGGGDPNPGGELTKSPDIRATASDASGNVYLYDQTHQAVWRWDGQGRLACIKSKHQHELWHQANGSASTVALTRRMQLRPVSYAGSFSVPQIMFMSGILNAVGGIYDFKTGDFDRDGALTSADIVEFNTQVARPIETFVTGTAPSRKYYEAVSNGAGVELQVDNPVNYEKYLRCDLNGNGLVDEKDREILNKFLVDLDGDNDVDGSDYGLFAGCFNGTGNLVSGDCLKADFNGDQCVDGADYGVFAGCFNGTGNLSPCFGL